MYELMENFRREVKLIKGLSEMLEIKNMILFHGLQNNLSTSRKGSLNQKTGQ